MISMKVSTAPFSTNGDSTSINRSHHFTSSWASFSRTVPSHSPVPSGCRFRRQVYPYFLLNSNMASVFWLLPKHIHAMLPTDRWRVYAEHFLVS
jgi:hypothetical protein